MSFIQDTFTLGNEDDNFKGWHDPTVRWNGFACPLFTLATVREIKVLLDKWAAEMPYEDSETIEIDDDGKVFMVNEYDGPAEEHPVKRDDPSLPDEPLYAIGSFGWTWIEVAPEPTLPELDSIEDGPIDGYDY